MLLDHRWRSSQACRNVLRRKSVDHVETPGRGAWQQEFACEQIHPDLAPLARTIVKHPLDADRGILDRAVGLDLLGNRVLYSTFQHYMPEFMGNEKGTIEVGAGIFVQDDSGLAVEGGASAFQLRITRG